jgi:hypothetical protein
MVFQKWGHLPVAPQRVALCKSSGLLLFLAAFLLSAFAPQFTSLGATLPASRPPPRTSFHAACAPLLTPLCASHRGRRGGLLRLGLSI